MLWAGINNDSDDDGYNCHGAIYYSGEWKTRTYAGKLLDKYPNIVHIVHQEGAKSAIDNIVKMTNIMRSTIDGVELIQYRVGYILHIHGGIYLDNILFLFDDNDSICGHIFEEDRYLVP